MPSRTSCSAISSYKRLRCGASYFKSRSIPQTKPGTYAHRSCRRNDCLKCCGLLFCRLQDARSLEDHIPARHRGFAARLRPMDCKTLSRLATSCRIAVAASCRESLSHSGQNRSAFKGDGPSFSTRSALRFRHLEQRSGRTSALPCPPSRRKYHDVRTGLWQQRKPLIDWITQNRLRLV